MLGHKTNLNKFKRIENISSIFFQPQQYKSRNQLQEEKWGKHKHVETKQHATKNQWVNEEVKEEIRKYLKTNKNKNITLQNLWDTAKGVLRTFYSDTGLPQETRKISNK